MAVTINTIASIDSLDGNSLSVEVMPNTIRGDGLQFYYLNNDANNITYTKFPEFSNKLKESLRSNKTFYITFCGINKKNKGIPDYLYLIFSGNDIQYKGYMDDTNSVFLEFNFRKTGKSLETEITNLFTENVGVFIQAYL